MELEASIGTHNSTLEGTVKLKFGPFRSSFEALTKGIISYLSQMFQDEAENNGLIFGVRMFFDNNMSHKKASQ